MIGGNGLFEGTEPVLRIPASLSDINAGGDIFGGWTMSQIDIAGGITAVLRSRGRVVTAAVEHMVFKKPVKAGDIVSLYAQLVDIGRTSMKVDVQVYVHRNPQAPEFFRVAEATLTYVAVDAEGKPRPVPPEAPREHRRSA